VVLVLVGNKSDLEAKREVTIAEGEQLKSEKGMHLFCETSALDGTNIDEVFKKTATLTLDHY
jgi:GTPase SAR1 family protein